MLHYEPKDLSVPEVHKLLLGGVAPRPIALVSTISKQGVNNLTPFSFYNVFGANPPVVAFSPSRRGRDASFKDTYFNLVETKECVINSVTYPIVEQINLASTEYPPEINEFDKSGLTPIASDLVKPKRVKESPFQMECQLREIRSFGEGGASANIAICEVVKIHAAEDIFNDGNIEPDLIDLVGRMSGNYYTRSIGSSIFKVEKPGRRQGIGYDNLPELIKTSHVYSGNNLGKFGMIENIPSEDEIARFIEAVKKKEFANMEISDEAFYRYKHRYEYEKMLKVAFEIEDINSDNKKYFIELAAKTAIEKGDINFAWKAALSADRF